MVPSLLIGCSGTHWVKSNVMTGRGLVRARHGYSHSGCGSASRDSRKSKDCWSRSQKHINQLLNPRIIIYIPDQNLEAVLLTWIISSIGLTSKPSQVPQGNRILHRSWWTNTKEQLRSQSVWKCILSLATVWGIQCWVEPSFAFRTALNLDSIKCWATFLRDFTFAHHPKSSLLE